MRMESPLNQRLRWSPPDVVYTPIDVTSRRYRFGTGGRRTLGLVDSPAGRRTGLEARQASGSYSFRSEIVQTTLPPPKLSSARRRAREEHLTVDGSIDQPAKSMEMILWTGANLEPESGVQVRVEGDRAYGRVGDQGQWEEVDNMAGAFAPGVIPLASCRASPTFSSVAPKHAASLGLTSRSLHTRYTFDLDGRAFAEYVAEQIEAHLIRSGELRRAGKCRCPMRIAT